MPGEISQTTFFVLFVEKKILNSNLVFFLNFSKRIIRELRQEVEALREMLKQACVTSPLGMTSESRREDLTEKLTESERLVKEMSQTWEEKLLKTGTNNHT